jgi:hypothetical protein
MGEYLKVDTGVRTAQYPKRMKKDDSLSKRAGYEAENSIISIYNSPQANEVPF